VMERGLGVGGVAMLVLIAEVVVMDCADGLLR